jgi:hypothetical protein
VLPASKELRCGVFAPVVLIGHISTTTTSAAYWPPIFYYPREEHDFTKAAGIWSSRKCIRVDSPVDTSIHHQILDYTALHQGPTQLALRSHLKQRDTQTIATAPPGPLCTHAVTAQATPDLLFGLFVIGRALPRSGRLTVVGIAFSPTILHTIAATLRVSLP